MPGTEPVRALCDSADCLVEAGEALARLHAVAGGAPGGTLAIPELMALVRHVRAAGLPQARTITARDGVQTIAFRALATPADGGVAIVATDWRMAAARSGPSLAPADPGALWHHLAEAHLLLDGAQRVVASQVSAPDLAELGAGLPGCVGQHWASALDLPDAARHAGLHWRLLDDMVVDLAGSRRRWRVRLLPRGGAGFDLLLLPEMLAAMPAVVSPAESGSEPPVDATAWTAFLGRDLAPALRQPISRIIANAETIRSRLAGPLAESYGNYAGDIAEAGRHLLGLVEDLADLDAVEAPGFAPMPDHIDLADCARRAAGILSVRARERDIVLAVPEDDCHAPAVGEFRRVLQVLLNLLSNAIRYTPASATVELSCGVDGAQAWIAVQDRGDGLTAEQAARVFEKFERLGRKGDGGSGLGLYISRRLARAMAGDLTVSSTPGEGARFVLTLPADVPAAGIVNAR